MTTISPTLDLTTLLDDARAMAPQVIDWRRHLHRHPEVAFHEHQTAQFIHDVLAVIPGLDVTRPTETSVMARLVGAQPGRVIAVRADIAALPIHDETAVVANVAAEGQPLALATVTATARVDGSPLASTLATRADVTAPLFTSGTKTAPFDVVLRGER